MQGPPAHSVDVFRFVLRADQPDDTLISLFFVLPFSSYRPEDVPDLRQEAGVSLLLQLHSAGAGWPRAR